MIHQYTVGWVVCLENEQRDVVDKIVNASECDDLPTLLLTAILQ